MLSRPSNVARGSWAKSAYDIVGASALLLLASALMVLVAVAIKLESRGPVFYRSRRVGFGGRHFEMLKFRKMHRDAAGPPLTAHEDDRLTRVGAFLRRTRLDELPQLWNVLRGDMSLVGPRPEDPTFVALYPDEYADVLSVKPGITGLSQLAFAKESDILERPELAGRYADRVLPAKIAIDKLYVARRSTQLDTRILAWTVRAMLSGRDIAVDRRSARMSVRHRVHQQVVTLEEQPT
jgi:lipopolysaccharide/colanic/teichoic acid biosynthesis glycosyltransferase